MIKKVIIIDALNSYLRSYIVNPSVSKNGIPIGGVRGFLGTLQKFCGEIRPDKIVVAWDGPDGSESKRRVNEGYKQGRRPIRLNRNIAMLSEEQEFKNKVWQQRRLVEYLNKMPISQVLVGDLEADDVIAYTKLIMPGWKKIIISSDKDFIQLCDEETILYRPVQKEVLTSKKVIEKYGISPLNFALARAMAGDKSDNLPGVPRVGLKTVAKRFPFFAEERQVSFDRLYDFCEEKKGKVKIFENVLENKEIIESNYSIMQLYGSTFNNVRKYIINEAVYNMPLDLNQTGILNMMNGDAFTDYNWDVLFSTFRYMILSQVNKEVPYQICIICGRKCMGKSNYMESECGVRLPLCSEKCEEEDVQMGKNRKK